MTVRRNHFMINLHESMGPDRDRTRDPWICSQTRIIFVVCWDGCLALPGGDMGLSAVCDCGISLSYSLLLNVSVDI